MESVAGNRLWNFHELARSRERFEQFDVRGNASGILPENGHKKFRDPPTSRRTFYEQFVIVWIMTLRLELLESVKTLTRSKSFLKRIIKMAGWGLSLFSRDKKCIYSNFKFSSLRNKIVGEHNSADKSDLRHGREIIRCIFLSFFFFSFFLFPRGRILNLLPSRRKESSIIRILLAQIMNTQVKNYCLHCFIFSLSPALFNYFYSNMKFILWKLASIH